MIQEFKLATRQKIHWKRVLDNAIRGRNLIEKRALESIMSSKMGGYLGKDNLSNTFQQELIRQVIFFYAVIVALDRLNTQDQLDRMSYR